MQIKPNEITTIDLFVTEACNANCTYCFHKQNPETLKLEDGKKILDIMFKMSPDTMTVNFWGGEPLLFPQLVLDLALYARSLWGKKVSFTVTTNCSYFNEEMFTKYRELGFAFNLSIDGDEITMTEHRKGLDVKKVLANALKISEFMHPYVSVRMTVTPETVGRLSINMQFCIETLGIFKVMHQAVIEDKWAEESINEYAKQLQNIYHYRRYMLKRDIPINIVWIDKPLKIINDEAPAELNFCEAGKSYVGILPNGDVYPCHRAASNRLFKLGNIYKEIPFVRGMFLTLDKEYAGCSQRCRAYQTCHTCVITQHLVNNSLTKPVDNYCKLCHIEYDAAQGYLSTELADRFERMQFKIAKGLLAVAEQNEEVLSYLKKENKKDD